MATIQLTTNTVVTLASPLVPKRTSKTPQSTFAEPRAPIVVSELDEEDVLLNMQANEAEERDDLEELHDFTSLLMPAARQSAARRLNSIGNDEQQRRTNTNALRRLRPNQRNVNNSSVMAKFPLFDEDLLMLATRKAAGAGIAPPNLCRLITNVSECRWTTKIEAHPHQVSSSSTNAQLTVVKPRPKNEGTDEASNIVLRRKSPTEISPTISSRNLLTANNVNNQVVPNNMALRRLSALSMASSVTSYGGAGTPMDDASNCDCTSLAKSAFRRSGTTSNSKKRKKQAEQSKAKVDDDSYRKISPASTTTTTLDTPTNDSGISCSSDSSRSTSLFDAANNKAKNCSGCGTKFLPPSANSGRRNQIGSAALTEAVTNRRQLRMLHYLLGNMKRFFEVSNKNCKCERCSVNLKLMSTPKPILPLINIVTAEVEETDTSKKPGNAATAEKSPRWRSEVQDEAIIPGRRKEQILLQQQHEINSNAQSTSTHKHSDIATSKSRVQNEEEHHQQQKASETVPTIIQQKHVSNGQIFTQQNGSLTQKKVVQQQTQAEKQQQSQKKNVQVASKSAEKIPLDKDEMLVSPVKLDGAEKIELLLGKNNEKPLAARSPPPSYQQVQEAKEVDDDKVEKVYAKAIRSSGIAGKLASAPRFHYPLGRPVSKTENDQRLNRIRELFKSKPSGKISLNDFGDVCKQMDFAIYTKRAVYDACCQLNGLLPPTLPPLASTSTEEANEEGNEGPEPAEAIDFNQFCVYWNRMVSEAHDEAARFVFTLSVIRNASNPKRRQLYILREDFFPLLMDLILTHPGLHFLKEAPQFYSKYCEVVIVRIFWNVNRSWTGRITANELRKSNFLQTLRLLDEITDINKVTDYFSYEHFYVTYCKFWELDTDHDMVISREDMRRHCNGALTDRIIERIFSAAVVRTPPEQRIVSQPAGPIRQQPIETIGFEDFVCFLLAEEDKRHPTSIEYWFRCVDLDGDGQISLFEMEYFYEAIEQKLLAKNMETLSLRDVVCNLLDSIAPANGVSVTRNDLKRSGLAHRFFNTLVNWIKYVDQESSDGERTFVKTVGNKEISDWEVFCLTEYELLMSETDQASNEGDYTEENIDVILDDDEESESGEEREQQRLMNGFLQSKQQTNKVT